MKRVFSRLLAVVALTVLPAQLVFAEGDTSEKAAKSSKTAKSVKSSKAKVLAGTFVKEGSDDAATYYLETSKGKMELPAPKDAAQTKQWDRYAGQKVKIRATIDKTDDDVKINSVLAVKAMSSKKVKRPNKSTKKNKN